MMTDYLLFLDAALYTNNFELAKVFFITTHYVYFIQKNVALS
jgi:hypothetical protein